MDILISLILVITSQYTHISNYQVIYLKCVQSLFVHFTLWGGEVAAGGAQPDSEGGVPSLGTLRESWRGLAVLRVWSAAPSRHSVSV